MLDFAELLSRLRKNAEISQYALANKIGMNPTHLNRIERGERNPPKRDNVLKIAEVLGLNEEEKAELLIKARYAPQSINIGVKSYEVSEKVVYESPLGAEEIAKIAYKLDVNNPAVRLVAEALNDPNIPPKSKKEMEKEISSFVEWLRYKMRSNKYHSRKSHKKSEPTSGSKDRL